MPAKLNIGVNQIIELILQLPYEEKQTLFIELKKFSQFQELINDFLEIGKDIEISFEDITAEVENYRMEKFA
jgi:hypothetical protein